MIVLREQLIVLLFRVLTTLVIPLVFIALDYWGDKESTEAITKYLNKK